MNWKQAAGVLIGLGLSASAVLGAEPASRMYAEAVGPNAIDPQHTVDKLSMVLNNTEDRVGARARLCQSYSDRPCETLIYNFPQLRFDKSRGLVLMGDATVGTLHRHGMRIELAKPYRLGYEIAKKPVDQGFDKGRERLLNVYLEPAPKAGR